MFKADVQANFSTLFLRILCWSQIKIVNSEPAPIGEESNCLEFQTRNLPRDLISPRSSGLCELLLKVLMMKVRRLFWSGLPGVPAGAFIVVFWRGRLDRVVSVLLLPQGSCRGPRGGAL